MLLSYFCVCSEASVSRWFFLSEGLRVLDWFFLLIDDGFLLLNGWYWYVCVSTNCNGY